MMTSSDRHGNTKTKTTSMRMSLVAALILVLGGGFLLATLTMQQPQHRLLQRSHEHDDITGEDNFRLSLYGGHDGDADDDDDDADDNAIVKDHKRRLWNPKKEIKKWKDKANEWEKKYNEKKNRADELAREVTGLNSKVADLDDQVKGLNNQVKGLNNQVKDLTDDLLTASLEVANEIIKWGNVTREAISGALQFVVEDSAAALVGKVKGIFE